MYILLSLFIALCVGECVDLYACTNLTCIILLLVRYTAYFDLYTLFTIYTWLHDIQFNHIFFSPLVYDRMIFNSCIVFVPVDVIKERLQVQGLERYKHTFLDLLQIVHRLVSPHHHCYYYYSFYHHQYRNYHYCHHHCYRRHYRYDYNHDHCIITFTATANSRFTRAVLMHSYR